MAVRHFRRFSERRPRNNPVGQDRNYGSFKGRPSNDRQGILQEEDSDSDPGGTHGDGDGDGDGDNGDSVERGAASGDDDETDAPSPAPATNGPSSLFPPPNPSTCLHDGIRKIDFVLVYEEAAPTDTSASNQTPQAITKQALWRQRFLANLERVGLEMEEEIVESGNRKLVHFIRVHATWAVLCHYAEELNMRAPLQAYPNSAADWSAILLETLRLPNVMQQDVPCKPLDYYTCPFRKSKIDRFLGSDNHQTYFSNIQRSRVVYEILSTTMFGKKKKGEVGVERLVQEGVFSTAFPLHDGPYFDPTATAGGPGGVGCTMNPRQILYEYWARWGKWYKYQPLDHIREYFGEKIAIYFAWLGFYTGWLLPAAMVGVLVFLYGLFTMRNDPLANQVCTSEGSFIMCPLCDEELGCKFWDLSDVCGYARLAYLFDHPGTVFYAVFISLWAVTFLEYWKRKCASLAHHWDCTGFQEEEERPRPQFAARAPFLERNPVTGVREPSFPSSLRNKRVAAGIGIIILMMSLVIIFIVAVIIYRVLVSIPLFQNSTFRSQAQSIANLSGAVVNLILIMAMSRVYEKLAFRLTSWEMHRTQTEFDDNLTFKVFIFQFVNFYSSIFYIAFFKGRFVGYPGNYTLILRLRNEDCSAGGCLIELAQQLAVIMIGKQMINNAQEILVPKLKAWWQKKQVRLTKNRNKIRWEEDYQLVDSEGLFQEYLEMVLQFGFITIFVAAFPLAPLFALLNNWVEIRLDAQKFIRDTRRPVAERAENIGIWFKILHMLAHLAVISNGFLIAFTSEFLPKLLYQYEYHWGLQGYINFTLAFAPEGKLSQQCRYRGLRDPTGSRTPFFWRLLAIRFAFVIIFEHVVFGICRLIDILVPDIPESLELKIKRERYLAKQALQDSDTILRLCAQVSGRGEEVENDIIPLDSIHTPFGGMVLDLTSELGGLVPPLLIAVPPKMSPLTTVSPPPPPEPPPKTEPPKKPTRKPPTGKTKPPETPSGTKTQPRLRSRPRPKERPSTIVEVSPKTSLPRHSLSATHLSAAAASTSASFNASDSSSTLTIDDSIAYSTLLTDSTGNVADSTPPTMNRYSAPPCLDHVVVFDAENKDRPGSYLDVVLQASSTNVPQRRNRPLSASDSWDAGSGTSGTYGRLV